MIRANLPIGEEGAEKMNVQHRTSNVQHRTVKGKGKRQIYDPEEGAEKMNVQHLSNKGN